MTRVGLIFGGRSVEHAVSLNSARTVDRALRAAGLEVAPLAIAPDGCWLPQAQGRAALDDESIGRLEIVGSPALSTLHHLLDAGPEVLFPIVHGTWGEDGTLQGLCEMLDLPYVGTGVTASAVAMDKVLCKRVLAARGLPVVDDEVVEKRELAADEASVLARLERLPLPVFVKPSVGGSSVGVSRVDHRRDLAAALRFGLQFDQRVLVERGIDGRELECAVLGYDEIEASVMGEIRPGKAFYDYADKYLDDRADLVAPADLPPAWVDDLREVAVAAFEAIGGTGMARVDFLVEADGTRYINEINTLPGFTAISMFPRLWGLSGLPLPRLVTRLVTDAQKRHTERQQLDVGIKQWIASLDADIALADQAQSVDKG